MSAISIQAGYPRRIKGGDARAKSYYKHMENQFEQQVQAYVSHRRQHPAWMLLTARSAPLLLATLQYLLKDSHDGVPFETAQQLLSELISSRTDAEEFGLKGGDSFIEARKELRTWVKRGLVVEREGRLLATDALEEALRFADSLGSRIMTSSASRLSIVQREIEHLESNLNPDPKSRADRIKRQIAALEIELQQVEAGNIKVLTEAEAIEGVREVFNLATSLKADFRRVEDSYREADQHLRQSILREKNDRGDIVDRLLDGHDQLIDTPEGRVFQGFQQQLNRSLEIDNMKLQLRSILRHAATRKALNHVQQSDLRWLMIRLVKESESVIRARARSEKDVKGFLKTGLAVEHYRVGELLNEVLNQALDINWGNASVRRAAGPLPPTAVANASLPLVERLRIKSVDQDEEVELDLGIQAGNIKGLEADFWVSFDSLDRQALVDSTLEILNASDESMDIAALAKVLPPTHDLETIALWLSMAREAGLPLPTENQAVDIEDRDGKRVRFQVPRVALSAAVLAGIDWEL
jgi:hypothetical protein